MMRHDRRRRNPFTAVEDLSWECDSHFEDAQEAMDALSEHYPESVQNSQEMIDEWLRVRGHKVYSSMYFKWLGEEGRMLRLTQGDLDAIYPIEGNIFDTDKLCAIVESVRHFDFKVPLYCGYAALDFKDCCEILEMKEYEDDIDYYAWSADDAGEVYFQLRDGNHRTIGALAAGDEAYVYLAQTEYDQYREWVDSGKPKDHYRYTTFMYLDQRLL